MVNNACIFLNNDTEILVIKIQMSRFWYDTMFRYLDDILILILYYEGVRKIKHFAFEEILRYMETFELNTEK